MARRASIRRRYSLAGAGDGWDEQCYVSYYPASYREYLEYRDIQEDGLTEDRALEIMVGFIKRQFAAGQWLMDDDDGTLDQLTVANVDDIESLPPEVLGELFMTVVGRAADPKASPKEQAPAEEQASSEQPTETPSSTDEPTEPTS